MIKPFEHELESTKTTSSTLSTKFVAEILIYVFGGILVILLITTGVATVINLSDWWSKRLRSHQRRMDSRGRNENIALSDRFFAHLCTFVQAMAWKQTDDAPSPFKTIPRTKNGRKSIDPGECGQTNLPLRFQPERLYGATSTVHRDNLRKKSWTNLSAPTQPNAIRRLSAIDSLLSWKTSSKSGESSHSNVPMSKVDGNLFKLPQIDVTCTPDDSEAVAVYDSDENLRTDQPSQSGNSLTVNLPIRRASSSNFVLSSNRVEENRSEEVYKALSIKDEAHSDVECSMGDRNTRDAYNIPITTKRSSLWDAFLLPCKETEQTVSQSKSTEHLPPKEETKLDLTKSSFPSKNEVCVKLPTSAKTRDMGGTGPQIALCINLEYGDSTGGIMFLLNLVAAKGIRSQRPWQKSTFILKFNLKYGEINQQASINCKDVEFGCLCFRTSPQLRFGRYQLDTQEGTNAAIEVYIFEHLSKWSGDREYFQGSLSLQLNDATLHETCWHPIEPAYPMLRIKADVLVSLCYRQLQGTISIGVQEVRNVEFSALGPWKLDDINWNTDRNNLDIDVHACLTLEGHLIKSKKSILLQREIHRGQDDKRRRSSAMITKPISETGKSKKHLSYDRWVAEEHFLQFSLPILKRPHSKLPLPNVGIVLFVKHKISTSDWLPMDCVDRLRSIGLSEEKSLNALGECFIGSSAAQHEYRRENAQPLRTDLQCAAIWSEAISHGASRVYQWLNVE